eukprot:scaffold300383_cov37-Tisochrysis_lutea.AAC.1
MSSKVDSKMTSDERINELSERINELSERIREERDKNIALEEQNREERRQSDELRSQVNEMRSERATMNVPVLKGQAFHDRMLAHFVKCFGSENVQSRGGIGGEGHCGDLWLKQGNKTVMVELKDAMYRWGHVKKA